MARADKPEIDLTETDAVVVDEDGVPRLRMESLQKHGGPSMIEER